ncbi:transcriptional regulator [Labedella populi]|uniref:Transcriptional regulator n=1 Tax=Labedella populi TaxID=2498850 RepID=A0A444Q6V1_9MICO|nr:type IV toxin-antitoxin system AbiEi family antitoxin domain-containing protein [Labedella populi]RWZ59634.1 transcriptional regulator [Labedella populi]
MSFRMIATLGAIGAGQWGMVTTQQAGEAGVPRSALARLAAAGAIERLAQGVYRMAGAPSAHEPAIDMIRVHWLALGGAARTVVAAGKSAAALHGIGDWFPSDSDFVTPERRTTRLPHVQLRIRRLESVDVTGVHGLPTMTVERTVADLVESWEDLSLVADAVEHAMHRGVLLWPKRLAELLEPLARRNQMESGVAFADRLLLEAGADASWRARLRG